MKKYNLFSSHQSIQDKQKVPIIDGKKECKKCHNVLPIEDFNVKPSGALTSYCKKCNNMEIYFFIKLLNLLSISSKLKLVPVSALNVSIAVSKVAY